MAPTTEQLYTLSNPVFAGLAYYAAVLVLKMLAIALLTTAMRMIKGVWPNPEDLSAFIKADGKDKRVILDNTGVERVRRNHLNDLENIPAFLFLALLYVSTQPSPWAALLHFRLFAGSRILHTLVYQLAVPQPARALCFFVGVGVCVSMAVQILRAI
jgi:glutathione S-transferase